MYHSSGPNTGSNPGGGRIQKNNNYELWSSEYANQLEIFQDFVDQDLDVIGVIDDLETKRTTMIVETGGSNVMSPNVVMSPISAITQRISMPILENDLFQQNFRDEQVIGFKFSNWNFFPIPIPKNGMP